jgi:hypothetical protein
VVKDLARKLAVLIGLREDTDGHTIPALAFRTWRSRAALGLAAATAETVIHFW